MNGGIVKDYECRTVYFPGETVKIIRKSFTVDGLRGVESEILACRRHHTENIEALFLLNRHTDILFGNCLCVTPG